MLRKLILLGSFGLLMGLTACNTVAGAGQDLSDSAHWVQNRL